MLLLPLNRPASLNSVFGVAPHPVAALFFTFLHRSSSAWWTPITTQYLLNTLRRTIDVVLSLVSKSGGYTYSSSGEPTTWCSLNLAITSGTQLICTRFADPPEREPPSLYWSTSSGATMDRRFEGHPDGRRAESGVRLRDGKLRRERRGPHVVVASEPMTRGQDEEWHLMKSGEVLVVEEGEMEGRREGGMDATCGEAVAVAL